MLNSSLSSDVLEFAVLPVAKVLVMCFLGYILATSRVGILTSENRKILSKLVFAIFLPCLIFIQLGSVVTVANLKLWWFIPVNVVLSFILGCGVGYIVALIIRPPKIYFGLTIGMIGIGNIGNIPLVLIDAICSDSNNPFGSDCETNGEAYIGFGQWIMALVVYTVIFRLQAPPKPIQPTKEDLLIIGPNSLNSRNSFAYLPSLANEDGSVHKRIRVNAELDSLSESEPTPQHLVLSNADEMYLLESEEGHAHLPSLPEEPRKITVLQNVYNGLCWFYRAARLQDLVQPPVIAAGLAILAGCVTPIRNLTFEENSFFWFLTESIKMMGEAMIPCIMLTLGGNLIGGPSASKLGLRTTITVIVVRLLFIPLMGIGVVTLAEKLGFFPTDDLMFKFVLLLQHSMPTAILTGAVANLHGFGIEETTTILFWEHILAIFTMAFWLFIFFEYLLV